MDWNNLIFPIPKPSYSKMSFPNQIIWVPKKDYNYKDKLKYNLINMLRKKSSFKILYREMMEGENH